MKRRNAECGKLRRPLKRSKITENFYGSMLMYVKFLLIWLLVLLADFILEFRFEYLWPFWLLLRSVHDSFKYQGLAFSVFFVCIAVTSDMICFLFIPVHWLFFAASTYVWVQYVWHTDRGICLPTISLWLLFVYIEASVRLKELKNLPFHLDLCRPFAAHCIGYPMVTLGFGFKSYVGYRMRQRKQKEVAKENEFYIQLVQLALPQEQHSIAASSEKSTPSKNSEETVANGVAVTTAASPSNKKSSPHATSVGNSGQPRNSGSSSRICDGNRFSEVDPREMKKQLSVNNSNSLDKELEYMENRLHKHTSINDFDESSELEKDKSFKANGMVATSRQLSSTPRWAHGTHAAHLKENKENIAVNAHSSSSSTSSSSSSSCRKAKNNAAKETTANNISTPKDEHVLRLEADIKRLKADLQASRQLESDLRSQISSLSNGERVAKNELGQLQQDNETLQTKLHGLVTARQQDKQNIMSLEKRLQEEKKTRLLLETQLISERKAKKIEESNAARAVAMSANNVRIECTENCKVIRRDLENEIKQMRRELKICEERRRQFEREVQSLRQYKDSHNEAEVLMSALSAMQDKNAHLENSLSAETRVKLDLFSALGEVKRQIEITQALLVQKDKEIDELKSKIAEVMAVMPQTAFPPVTLDSAIIAPPSYTSKFVTEPKITASSLDPNASVYTPKGIPGVAPLPTDL